jgi:hypothetical protein
MRQGSKVLAVVLAGLVLAPGAAAQATLRYKFKEGEKLVCAVDIDQKSHIKLLEGFHLIDMTMKFAIELSWQTLKVDDKGNAKAKVTVSHVRLKVAGGGFGTIDIDSKEKYQEEHHDIKRIARIVKGIAGIEMTLTVSPTGDVTEANVSGGQVRMIEFGGLGGDIFNADAMKSTVVGSIIIPLPKECVTREMSWSQKNAAKTGMGKIISDTKFTYMGQVEKGGKTLIKLAVNRPEMKIEPGENADPEVKIKQGNSEGCALFDNELGRVVQVTTDTRMQVERRGSWLRLDGQTREGAEAELELRQKTAIRIQSGGETTSKANPSPAPPAVAAQVDLDEGALRELSEMAEIEARSQAQREMVDKVTRDFMKERQSKRFQIDIPPELLGYLAYAAITVVIVYLSFEAYTIARKRLRRENHD